MKKAFIALIVFLVSTASFAKTKMIYSDGRFNEVRISDLSKKEAERLAPTHPARFTEEQIRSYLRNVKLAREFILSKEVETQDVFDDRAINFLAPKLVQGLSEATDKQIVEFSYLTKDPIFVLRNDRVSAGKVWAKGTDLHISFGKLFAKLLGDYDKRGNSAKTLAKAKGLRISLDLVEGQSYGDSTGELVIDTTYDFNKPATEPSEKVAEDGKGNKDRANKAERVPDNRSPAAPAPERTVRDRLKELDQLKEDGLITDKDYKRKKNDILKGL